MQHFIKFGQGLSLILILLGGHVGVKAEVNLSQETLCEGDLSTAIEAVIQRPEFERSQWGIFVQPLDSENPIYALNHRAYFLPASNVKLLTTAAALLRLGENYRVRTPLYTTGQGSNLTTLTIIGRGDPTITTAKLRAIALQLYAQGVRRIETLIAEDSKVPGGGRHPTWEFGDLNFAYAAALNRLILNQNRMELRIAPQNVGEPIQLSWKDDIAASQWQIDNLAVTVPAGTSSRITVNGVLGQPSLQIRGSLAVDAQPGVWGIAVLDPTRYFLDTLRSQLEAVGIEVVRSRVASHPSEVSNTDPFATIESPPLAEILRETNQNSNNLYAEALLQILGTEVGETSGLKILEETLTALGVDPESYDLVDGSGLSRHNFLSPEAAVQTLRLMARSPQEQTYRNSLAVPGDRGTLVQRFLAPPLPEIILAKTGTMTGVSSLSGYLNVPEYRSLAFSIILNRAEQSSRDRNSAIDEIVLSLSQIESCFER